MSIEGTYSGHQFAKVPLDKEYDEWIRIHEEAHRFLTQSTPWGHVIVFLQDIAEVDLDKNRSVEYYPSVCSILFQASEYVQESYAILSTLHQARLRQNRDVIQAMQKDDYIRKVFSKYLDIYMRTTPAEKAFQICEYLARIALEAHLLDIAPEHWATSNAMFDFIFANQESHYPDFRFRKLVDEVHSCLSLPDPQWEELVNQLAGLENQIMTEVDYRKSIAKFTQLMTALFPESDELQQALKRFSQRIKTEDSAQRSTLASHFEIPDFQTHYKLFPFDTQLFPRVNQFDVLYLYPYEDTIGLKYISNRYKAFTYFQVGWSNIKSYIDIFPKEIIVPYVDSPTVAKHALFSQERRVFYYAECLHEAFEDCLADMNAQVKPSIHFRQVNDSTFGVFVQVRKNQILFCFQKKHVYKLFVKDIQDGKYSHISCEASPIDHVFCENESDELAYREVVQSITQIHTSAKRTGLDFEYD